MPRFRLWCSSRYLRISPLHLEFQAPLPTSSQAVCPAVPRLSRGLSRDTYQAAYTRFKPNDSEQRLPPLSYRGCWHRVSRGFLWVCSTPGAIHSALLARTLTAVYTPKGFLLHAALLGQACAHCPIFVTAATRRCPGSVSVPMRRATLSRPLPVAALVSRYLTNKLIGHGPLPDRQARRSPPLVVEAMRLNDFIRYYQHFR